MRFGLSRNQMRVSHAARLRGLGQISNAELDAVNARLAELGDRIARQYSIIYEAQRGGFGSDIVGEAMRSYDRITASLQALASTPPNSGAELQEWLARAEGVDTQVSELERYVQSTFPGGAVARTVKIMTSTGGVLLGAAAIALGVWYYSRSRRWYRHVYGRRRRAR